MVSHLAIYFPRGDKKTPSRHAMISIPLPSCFQHPNQPNPTLLSLPSKLIQHPPRLINLQSQIRRPPSIRVIRQHNRLIPFRKFRPRNIPLTNISPLRCQGGTLSGLFERPRHGSFWSRIRLWRHGLLIPWGLWTGFGSAERRGDRLCPGWRLVENTRTAVWGRRVP